MSLNNLRITIQKKMIYFSFFLRQSVYSPITVRLTVYVRVGLLRKSIRHVYVPASAEGAAGAGHSPDAGVVHCGKLPDVEEVPVDNLD